MSDRRHDLVLRCDGGPGIGSGHVARCLAVGERWRHGSVHLVGAGVPQIWADRIREHEVAVHPPDRIGALAGSSSTVVVDGYHLGSFRAMGVESAQCVRIDDFGASDCSDADLIIDPSSDPAADLPLGYEGRRVLWGHRYVLLATSIVEEAARGKGRADRSAPARLTIAVGGAPDSEVIAWAETVVQRLREPVDVDWLIGVEDPASVLARSDAALSLAGSTTWELCHLGVPAVYVAASDNQDAMLQRIARERIGIPMGRLADSDPLDVAAAVEGLLRDGEESAAIRRRARQLLDGLGARRVATAIRGARLQVRRAGPADRDLYLSWANDEDTRRASFHQEQITPDSHRAWFERKSNDPRCQLLVVNESDVPLGQFRVDREGGVGVVSVSIDAGVRGLGLGAPLIEAGARAAFASDARIDVLHATIKRDNVASIRSFVAADFDHMDEGESDGVEWVRLARVRLDARDGGTAKPRSTTE